MDSFAGSLIDVLRADAARHEQGRFAELGRDFDEMELYRSQHPDLPCDRNESVAHTFWDAWIDQVRHGFGQNFYSGISAAMWPVLAREIADNLESGSAIANSIVLRHFDWTV